MLQRTNTPSVYSNSDVLLRIPLKLHWWLCDMFGNPSHHLTYITHFAKWLLRCRSRIRLISCGARFLRAPRELWSSFGKQRGLWFAVITVDLFRAFLNADGEPTEWPWVGYGAYWHRLLCSDAPRRCPTLKTRIYGVRHNKWTKRFTSRCSLTCVRTVIVRNTFHSRFNALFCHVWRLPF